MNVNWNIEALLDLDECFGMGTDKAISFYERVGQLQRFPMSGRKVPEINNPAIREIIFKKYRIVYSIQGNNISIEAVFHSRQDISNTRLGEHSDQ